MKIRQGFVSNSSSSSFVCDVCGYEISGFDISLDEYDMWQCENGHIFCNDHFDKDTKSDEAKEEMIKTDSYYKKKFKEKFNKEIEEATNEELKKYIKEYVEQDIFYEMRYELPETFCPCCNFTQMTSKDIIKYFFKKHNVTYKILEEEMKKKFKDYKDFKKWLKT